MKRTMRDRMPDENCNMLCGLSHNQICIDVVTDKIHTICFVEALENFLRNAVMKTFKEHIAPG